jgi:hypothetical protein
MRDGISEVRHSGGALPGQSMVKKRPIKKIDNKKLKKVRGNANAS